MFANPRPYTPMHRLPGPVVAMLWAFLCARVHSWPGSFGRCLVLGGTQSTGLLYVAGRLMCQYHDVSSLCLCQAGTALG